MSEAAIVTPEAAVVVASDYAPQAAPDTAWGRFERGWRPAFGYSLQLTVLVRACIIPLGQFLRHAPIDPVDWPSLITLAGVLAIARSYDKAKGTA